MDRFLAAVVQKRIEQTVEALRKNRFEAFYLPTKKELLAKISQMMPQGCSCSVGGSMTIKETGVHEFLQNGKFTYYDREAPGADPQDVMRKALSCDVYLTSSNAITMDGELHNVDGNANRLAAICFGPKKVIVVAGHNKIVSDISAAQERMRHIAAPANATRLSRKTPCVTTGICQDCSSLERICCQELITRWQREAGRICVLIVGEEYGY